MALCRCPVVTTVSVGATCSFGIWKIVRVVIGRLCILGWCVIVGVGWGGVFVWGGAFCL